MFNEWLELGWRQGWISPPVCYDHDGIPLSEAEELEIEEYGEVCVHILRLYESDLHRRQVEKNCAPAVWRASNLGWSR